MLPSIMHTIQCPLDNIKEKTLEEKDIKNIFNNKFTQESKEKKRSSCVLAAVALAWLTNTQS